MFDLGAHGVALVGTCRAGCRPSRCLTLSSRGTTPARVALAAVALVLIGFSQTAGDARAFAAKHRYQIDIDQESVAQAMANVGRRAVPGDAGLDEPVGELAERPLRRADRAWPRSPPASWCCSPCSCWRRCSPTCPKPVLAALIIEAVVMGMMDLPEMRRLFRVQRFDFWIAVAAIAGTLVFGVLAGVMIGIGLSLLWLISVATRPQMPLAGPGAGHPGVPRRSTRTPRTSSTPASSVLRLDGGLFFATADALEDRVREVVHVDAGRQRDRPRLRGHRLRRLPGLRQAARDPRPRPTTPPSRSGWPG